MATLHQSSPGLSFASKAHYKMCVQGYIDSSWSDRMGGLTITSSFEENNKPITTLEGVISDQSELVGIINSIYEMHLPLLSVTFVEAT